MRKILFIMLLMFAFLIQGASNYVSKDDNTFGDATFGIDVIQLEDEEEINYNKELVGKEFKIVGKIKSLKDKDGDYIVILNDTDYKCKNVKIKDIEDKLCKITLKIGEVYKLPKSNKDYDVIIKGKFKDNRLFYTEIIEGEVEFTK